MRSHLSRAAAGNRSLRSGGDAGFALVVVLLVLALVGAAAVSFTLAVRAYLRSTAALVASSEAETLADGGVHAALQDLLAAREDRTRGRRYPLDGRAVVCRIGDTGRVTIKVEDEAGRVDLNNASERLLRAVLSGTGLAPDSVAQIADRILDFRDRDADKRPRGAERPEYSAAGLPGPKNAPFEAVDELMQVLGADALLVERLRESTTVYSGLAGIDPKAMPAARAAAIAAGDVAGSAAFASGSRPSAPGLLPPELIEVSPQRVFSIRADAATSMGARFIREAIVDLGPRRGRAPEWRRWVRGPSRAEESGTADTGPLPPC